MYHWNYVELKYKRKKIQFWIKVLCWIDGLNSLKKWFCGRFSILFPGLKKKGNERFQYFHFWELSQRIYENTKHQSVESVLNRNRNVSSYNLKAKNEINVFLKGRFKRGVNKQSLFLHVVSLVYLLVLQMK